MDSSTSSLGFQQYWLIWRRRRLPALAVFTSVLALTWAMIFLQKPIYQFRVNLAFKKINMTSSLTGMGKEIGELNSLEQESSPLNTEVEIIRSDALIYETINALSLQDTQGNPLKIKDFSKSLNVSNIRGTDILEVSYNSEDPQKASTVVNTLIAIYLKDNLQAKRAEVVAAREFVEKQLPSAETTVRQAEAALRKFQEENNVVDLEDEVKSAVEVMADLESQMARIQTELEDAIAQSTAFQNKLNMTSQEALAATSLSQSSVVQDALKELTQVERQLAVEQIRFQDKHPVITELKSKKAILKALLEEQVTQVLGSQTQSADKNLQIGELKPKLIEEFVKVEAKRQGLASQVSALSNVQNTYKQRINVLPKLQQEQRELKRQLEAAQTTYSLLLQKLQEIRIAENQNVGNARLLSTGLVPQEPIATRKSLYLLTGAFLGGLLSLGTALALEARDRSIRTVDEAKELFALTLLGVIPSYKKLEKMRLRKSQSDNSASRNSEKTNLEIVVRDNPRSPISAAYRMLQANLKFLSSDKQLKAIVVTSSVPKEGKSTVCANLAVVAAQSGRKVLLIDADMHHPLQHRIWDLPNQVGLSNILVGQAELKTAIEKVMPNLDVLTSGVMPPNPVALLDSHRMALLIENFSAIYDFTIIDTPSLNVAADALPLGLMADGVLVVVRPGVDSASAAFAKEFLQKSGQNILGIAVNGVIPRNEPHSYYYFAKEYGAEESALADKDSAPQNLQQ